MLLSIGEFARRLRVTPRTVRHYQDLGLLQPESVNVRTGYRSFGVAQLVRGLQIEQLKAAGVDLATIARLLGDGSMVSESLDRHRSDLVRALSEKRVQLVSTEALLSQRAELAHPEIVDVPATHAVVVRATATAESLARTIRGCIQRVGRSVRVSGGMTCRSFSARFPLDVPSGPFDVDVAGHLADATPRSTLLPPERRLALTWVGPVVHLPLAYDVVLDAARNLGLRSEGSVVEHYLDLAIVGRTELGIPILVPNDGRSIDGLADDVN